jgi:hypothetical protein
LEIPVAIEKCPRCRRILSAVRTVRQTLPSGLVATVSRCPACSAAVNLGGRVESADAPSRVVLGRLRLRRRKPDVELSPEATAALDLVRRLQAAGWTTGGAKVLPKTVGAKVVPRRPPTP